MMYVLPDWYMYIRIYVYMCIRRKCVDMLEICDKIFFGKLEYETP